MGINKKFSLIIIFSFVLMSVVVLYPLFIDIWIENASGSVYNFLEKIYNIKISFIYVFFIITVGLAFLYFVYKKYKEDSEGFEQEKRETSRTLLRKYNELKEFDQKKTLSILMEKFCLKYDFIYAIQIYNYENIPESKTVRCKINHVDGFVKDNKDLNGMIQQNYHLNKRLYRSYTNAMSKFINDVNEIGPLVDFISENVERIQKKSCRSLDKEDAMVFALLKDSIDILSYFYDDIRHIVIDSRKIKKLELLLKDQRNGILRGILLGVFYSFIYEGANGNKEGRQYVTNLITLSDVKYVVLMILDPELLEEDEEIRNQALREYLLEFEDMLHRSFESSYNDEKKGDEYSAL